MESGAILRHSATTITQLVHRSIVAFVVTQIPREFRAEPSAMNTCAYWRQHGNALSPALPSVAQSVLGAPASAAVPERDFCVAGQVVLRHRGSLDPA